MTSIPKTLTNAKHTLWMARFLATSQEGKHARNLLQSGVQHQILHHRANAVMPIFINNFLICSR